MEKEDALSPMPKDDQGFANEVQRINHVLPASYHPL